jgi:serine/threonine protein kinase
MKLLVAPNIVQLMDSTSDRNFMFLVQEFCDGDLTKQMKNKGSFSEDEALVVIKDVLSGFLQLI